MDRCEECGFVYDLTRAEEAGAAIVASVTELAGLLRDGGPELCTRRAPQTWSALEYGCHVRDVLLVQRERALLARRSDRPVAEPMGRDERVDHDGYADQAPDDVARQLMDAARLFANVLSRLGPDWDRTLHYTYPEPRERSLRWLAVHTLHEARHHLSDARRQVSAGQPSTTAE